MTKYCERKLLKNPSLFLSEKKNCYILLEPESEFSFALMMIKHTNEFGRLGFLCYIIAENYYLL